MYVRNRVPTKALDGHTPYRVLYDMKLELEILCTFGALYPIIRPNENLKRMDCGLSYEHQQGICDICATYVHTNIEGSVL